MGAVMDGLRGSISAFFAAHVFVFPVGGSAVWLRDQLNSVRLLVHFLKSLWTSKFPITSPFSIGAGVFRREVFSKVALTTVTRAPVFATPLSSLRGEGSKAKK